MSRPVRYWDDGYDLRPDGTYAKTVQFVEKRKGGVRKPCGTVTLVRSARTGRLLRVERGGRVKEAR